MNKCFFDLSEVLDPANINSICRKIRRRRINRKLIGAEKTKETLREAISFKHIKIEELMHNYVDYLIMDKQLYVIMDCIELKNLCPFTTEKIQLSTKLEWFKDLTFAIDYLHLHFIVHKKIFMRNIYIKNEKRVILGEMGFKHEIDLFRQDAENYQNILYYPNDYFKESVDNITLSFDIWSLGVVFWEILTQKKLFERENEIINENFIKDILRNSILTELEEFILREMLVFEKSKRKNALFILKFLIDYKDTSKPLFFPIDDVNSFERAKEVADLILDFNLENMVEHFFSFLIKRTYLDLQQLLEYFCEKMFVKKNPDIFFKLIDQLSKPGFEFILVGVLRRILLPENGLFFSFLFTKSTPDFFQNYRHVKDKRNILHFAAEHSNKQTIFELSSKYKSLLNERDIYDQIPLDFVIRRLNQPGFEINDLNKIINLFNPTEKIKLNQESLNAICQKGDAPFLKEMINKPNRFEFKIRDQLEETAFDIILSKMINNNRFHYKKLFILSSDILDNQNFARNSLNADSFVRLFLRNDAYFIKAILSKFKFNFPDNFQTCKETFKKCVELSAQSIQCFQLLYEFDSEKNLFNDELLKHCLENQCNETFLWLLDRFESVIASRDKEFELLYRNIKWETGTDTSLFKILIEKCKANRQFLGKAGLLFEKIFLLEEKVSAMKSEFVSHSLFFPGNDADNSLKSKIEEDCIEAIFSGEFLNVIRPIFSYLRNINYSRLENCLKLFVGKIFEKNKPVYFLKIIDQIKRSNLTNLLETTIKSVLEHENTKFFGSLFQIGTTPLAFKLYKQEIDKKNMLHLAAEKSNKENILILTRNYNFLLKERDNQKLTPMDFLLQRDDLDILFLDQIIDLAENVERKVELCQETLICVCKKDDVGFLEKLISQKSKFKFSPNDQLDESSLDIVVQRKTKTYIYGVDFVVTKIANNSNFDLVRFNRDSLLILFERNEANLLESLIFKVDYKKLILDDFKQCIEIFIKNENGDIAKIFFNFMIQMLSSFLEKTEHITRINDYILNYFETNKTFDSIIYGIKFSIDNNKHSFANDLFKVSLDTIKDYSESLKLILANRIIKEVLVPRVNDVKHFAYLNMFSIDFNLISLQKGQNILHFIGQTCHIVVFKFFFEKNKNDLAKQDTLDYSPLDYLIQNIDATKHDLNILIEIINSYLRQNGREKLKLKHKTLVSTFRLITKISSNKDNMNFVSNLIDSNNVIYNGNENQEDSDSSISLIFQKDSFGNWTFSSSFIKDNLGKLNEHSFYKYDLSHESFEALCERPSNIELMQKMLTVDSKLKFRFNHQKNSFDKCFEYAMQKERDRDMTYILFDYFRQVYQDEQEFFSKVIYYIVKFIGESVHNSKTEFNPEYAMFLIKYLDRREKNRFLILLKDSLIKTILKLKTFQKLVKYLLDDINFETFIQLDDKKSNILHYAATNCDTDIIVYLFKKTDKYLNNLSEQNQNNETPLDILISRKVNLDEETTSDFLKTLIKTLKSLDLTNEEKSLNDKVNDLIEKLENSDGYQKENSKSQRDQVGYCFNSESLKDLIEYLSKKSSRLTLNFNSFKDICDRSDSTKDRDFLITFFLSRINKISNKPNIAESTIHHLITKKKSDKKEFFFSSSNLKHFLSEQPTTFSFLVNLKSLDELFKRKDVDLVRAMMDQADFEELLPLNMFRWCVKQIRKQEVDTPLDLLIKAKDDDDQFVFSVQLLRKIKRTSNIYKFKFNQSTFESLCERNDSNLVQIMKKQARGFIRNKDLVIFKKPIEKFIHSSNSEMVKIVFDFIKNFNTHDRKCVNEELCQNIEFAIVESIKRENFKIATCVLEYAECNELKTCFDQKCSHYCQFFYNLFEYEKFIEHLLNEKHITLVLKNSIEALLKNEQNILHYIAIKCQINILYFRIFKCFFVLFKSAIGKHDTDPGNVDSKTPLDTIVQIPTFLDDIETKMLFKELIFKLPTELKFSLSMKSFVKLCEQFENRNEDQNVLISIIEKSDFYNTQDKSPIDILIGKEAYRNTFIIQQIKLTSSIFGHELNHETFKNLCANNDSNLFKCLSIQAKFKRGILSIRFLFDCVDIFVQNENVNLKLVELFLDYIFVEESKENVQPKAHFLFLVINRLIAKSIATTNYKLTECVLDYFNVRIHEEPYPFEKSVNKYLIDHDSFKKLKNDEAWKLIRKILDCSNFTKDSCQMYVFNYLDFETFSYNLTSNLTAIQNVNDQIGSSENEETSNISENTSLVNTIYGYSHMNYKKQNLQSNIQNAIQQPTIPASSSGDVILNLDDSFLGQKKKPIENLDERPLNWIAESGQKTLKDHVVTLKLLKLKWDIYPSYLYLFITFLQLIYLLSFTSLFYKCFIDSDKEMSEIIDIISRSLVSLVCLIIGILLIIPVWLGIRQIINKWLFSCSIITLIFTVIIFTYSCNIRIFMYVLWSLNLLFWILNLAYEGIQFWAQKKKKYLNSGKNLIEIFNLISNFIILVQLFNATSFRENVLNEIEEKQTSFFFRLVYVISPTCLLLRYITFALCLEKIEKFGIYIVAYRKALKKSLYLAPIVITMATGLIFSYKLNRIAPDSKFYNATILESVAQIGRTFLSNMEDVDDLGITTLFTESISSFILLVIFIVMIPTVLFNLLIGVSTGELTRILEVSDLIQYHMRLNFIVWTQKAFLWWKGVEWCKKKKLLLSIFKKPKSNRHKTNDLDFIEEKLEKSYETAMVLMRKEQQKQFELMHESHLQIVRELRAEIRQQNEKIQILQDGLLESMNQNEKKTEKQLKEIEVNSNQKLDFIASDIINKST